jgi:hypothetical protein
VAKTAGHLRSPVTGLKQSSRAVTVFLPQDVHETLRELASQNERSVSAEIRYLIRKYTSDPYTFSD